MSRSSLEVGRSPTFRSLSRKLLYPILGLMIGSLFASTLAFLGSIALTQNRLLQQQIGVETELVTGALVARAEAVANAAMLLANDPQVTAAIQDQSEAALSELNSRSVVVRERFEMDLIQIYDAEGQARTNLIMSSLYRESSLLDMVEAGAPVVRTVEEHMVLLCRVEMPGDVGTVIVGIDILPQQALDPEPLSFRPVLQTDAGPSEEHKN